MHKSNKMKLSRFDDHFAEMMKDPEFRKGYEALDAEFAIVEMLLDYRIKHDLTQAELAKRIGTKQSAIARLETGRANPTIKFLQRIATALGTRLVIGMQERG